MGSNVSRIFPSKKRFILGIIDVQNDFCEGGPLGVKDSLHIIGPINKLRFAYQTEMEAFVSKDYHPQNHMSFGRTHNKPDYSVVKLKLKMKDSKEITVEQTMWPIHCVRQTSGSDFHDDIIITKNDHIIKKGKYENVESYSAFGDVFGGLYEDTKLKDLLKSKKITDIILTGLATDYCVYHTALDAIKYGLGVHLILSCTRGVGATTTASAMEDMKKKGVFIYKTANDFYEYYDNIKK
jgi:nicotinamidase/pyrazinamidase